MVGRVEFVFGWWYERSIVEFLSTIYSKGVTFVYLGLFGYVGLVGDTLERNRDVSFIVMFLVFIYLIFGVLSIF